MVRTVMMKPGVVYWFFNLFSTVSTAGPVLLLLLLLQIGATSGQACFIGSKYSQLCSLPRANLHMIL